MDVKGMPTVDQAEGHAPGCDGTCGAEEIMAQVALIALMLDTGNPELAAKIGTEHPTAALFVMATIHGRDPIAEFDAAPEFMKAAVMSEMLIKRS
jgi:hypothetical protein